MTSSKTLPPLTLKKSTVVTPTITKTIVNDFSQIDNTNFESELMKREYQILQKIEIDKEMYLKVVNSLGHKHYVWLNQPGYINTSNKIVLHNSPTDIEISYSLKCGSLSLMNFDIFGYIFECGLHGIVLVSRNDEFKNTEKSYIYNNSIFETNFDNEEVIICPLVKISEILADNKIVLSSVHKISSAINENHYRNMKLRFEEIKTQNALLVNNFQSLILYIDNVDMRIHNRFDEAMRINNAYAETDNISDIDRKNYKKLKYNLAITEDLRNKFNQALEKFVNSYQGSLTDLSKLVQEYYYFLSDNYQDLKKIY